MSCAKIDPALHQAHKPSWIKVRLPSNPVFFSTKALISDLRLHTVCESAQCPNRWECWSQGTATMMIAGDRCTRACGFCAVTTAKPFAIEADEPQRVAEAVKRMKLKHVVITAGAGDDKKDRGGGPFWGANPGAPAGDAGAGSPELPAGFSRPEECAPACSGRVEGLRVCRFGAGGAQFVSRGGFRSRKPSLTFDARGPVEIPPRRRHTIRYCE